MSPQQRYGLGLAPAAQGGLSQKRKTKAITVSGKPKKFADGGKVELDSQGTQGMGRDTSKEATPSTSADEAVEAARKKNVERDIRRTINGAPIHNPRPANIPTVSGVVRG